MYVQQLGVDSVNSIPDKPRSLRDYVILPDYAAYERIGYYIWLISFPPALFDLIAI